MAMTQLGARSLEALLGDWRSGASANSALADRIRLLTLDGRVPVDTRLPAERELAARLGLSRTTVSAAYAKLREDGFLQSVRGSGSVTRLPVAPNVAAMPADPGFLDFSKAAMPAYIGIVDAARAAVEELGAHLSDAGYDSLGTSRLRAAIAERYTARGLPTSPDQVMVTIGAQHAIALLSRVLISRGDRAVIEVPTYPHAYEALRAAGARLVPVSVSPDDDAAGRGGESAAMAHAFGQANPSVAYIMPDFHNPTGRSLTGAERESLLAAAARQGTTVLADETTAELDIDRAEAFLPLAAYGDAVLIGSVGKTVWGGVRVGWIRADRPLIRKLVAARSSNDLGTPILEQLVVTRLLEQMDEILDIRREQLRVGRAHLEAALAAAFPDWHVPHVAGGLATWINLGAPVSSQLALAARGHGLLIAAGPRFGVDGAFERFLRLPISYSATETDAAVRSLALAWSALSRTAVPDSSLLADVV
jgi:DNA-binding transcriptional MocR family regulator